MRGRAFVLSVVLQGASPLLMAPAMAQAPEPWSLEDLATNGGPREVIPPDVRALRALHQQHVMQITVARYAMDMDVEPEVRRYADRLWRDHRLGDQRVRDLAEELGIVLTLPAAGAEAQRTRIEQTLTRLQEADDFQEAFLVLTVQSTRQAIQDLARLRVQVESDQVRELVGKMLPILEQHFRLGRMLRPGPTVG